MKSRRQLVLEQHTVAYSKSTRETHIDVRGKVNGEANTLSTGDGCGNMSTQNFVSTTDVRIRKLTPVECERLQAWPNRHTELGRKPDGSVYTLSNTQRYKICGNGVTASVSSKILTTLIPEGDVRVMSLFSGGGGTELALPSRFQVVGHCEFDAHASAVLHYHWPHIPNFHDVTKLVERTDVPEFDLLTFGFPCQSFSIAGLRQGFNDEKGRGNLIYNVFDIIQKHKPKYLLGENVKGLLSHDKGATFEAIMEGLSSCGYEVDFELVNSKHFGVAQNRERVFIFGRRID
jgi:site-specific DNA-cytosine methylase